MCRLSSWITFDSRLRTVVWIEIGQRNHRDDFTGLRLHQDRGRALGVHQLHAAVEHILEAVNRGQGVILLSAHFTTLEISGRLLAMMDAGWKGARPE